MNVMVLFLLFQRTSQNNRALINLAAELLTRPLKPQATLPADKTMVGQFQSPPSNEQSKGIGVMHPLCSVVSSGQHHISAVLE